MRARLAWILAALSLACAVADTVITASFRPLFSEESVAVHGWPLATAATVGCAIVGALIISRFPGHPIGWLLSTVGATSALALVGEGYGLWVISRGGPGPDSLGYLAGWLSVFFGGPLALAGLAVLFLLAPDGRPLSRRWRYAVVVALVGIAMWEVGVLLTPPSSIDIEAQERRGPELAQALTGFSLPLIFGALVASVVSLILRIRRSDGVARRQLRWIAASAVALPIGFVILIAVQLSNGNKQTFLASTPLFLAYFCFPIFVGVAILRYRLYDIDLIINRAAVLTLATAFVALGYVGLVAGVGAVVDSRTTGFWPSMLAFVLVALAFQPLRRRFVRLADRLAYGSRAAPYEALADFSRSLADSPDPQSLLPAVAHAAADAVAAECATVRLHLTDDTDDVASWPPGTSDLVVGDVSVDVREHDDLLGKISIAMPKGRALRESDRRLLDDVAAQTALAFRNSRLSAELAARVAQLDQQTRELALSRSRIIAARDAERRRIESAIRREVTPHLERIPARLDDLQRRFGVRSVTVVLDDLVAGSVSALESLREITRGIFPTQLTRSGLEAAISSDLSRADRRATLVVDQWPRNQRFDSRIEAAAFFCYAETVKELQPPIEVALAWERNVLNVQLSGSAATAPDLNNVRDRLEMLAGTAACKRLGEKVVVTVTLPAEASDSLRTPDALAAASD